MKVSIDDLLKEVQGKGCRQLRREYNDVLQLAGTINLLLRLRGEQAAGHLVASPAKFSSAESHLQYLVLFQNDLIDNSGNTEQIDMVEIFYQQPGEVIQTQRSSVIPYGGGYVFDLGECHPGPNWVARVDVSGDHIFVPPSGVHSPDGDCHDAISIHFVSVQRAAS